MKVWRRQTGEITPGCVISLVLLLVAAIIAIKAVPAMMRVQEFQSEIERLADRANRHDYPPQRIQRMLHEKAQELRLPVSADAIVIKKTKKTFDVKVVYDLEVDFPFYTYVWHKEHYEERPLF